MEYSTSANILGHNMEIYAYLIRWKGLTSDIRENSSLSLTLDDMSDVARSLTRELRVMNEWQQTDSTFIYTHTMQ